MTRQLLAVAPGPIVSVQDLGRPGLQRHGVTEGGAIDAKAHHWGAALLGQEPALASLEMCMVGGRFRNGPAPIHVAVTGATGDIRIDGRPAPHSATLELSAGAEIEIGAFASGMYAYLSVSGGVAVDPVLGSRATHARAAFGGLHGRRIEAGDVIPVGDGTATEAFRLVSGSGSSSDPIRVLEGLHARLFDETAWELFEGSEYEVSAQRDRQGMRLSGPAVPTDRSLASSAVVAGDIQIGGDGLPTVLLVDRQPTGGYPRIATVIEADIGRLVQMMPGAHVRFRRVGIDVALSARREYLEAVVHPPMVPAGAGLWSENLISGITVGDMDDHDAD